MVYFDSTPVVVKSFDIISKYIMKKKKIDTEILKKKDFGKLYRFYRQNFKIISFQNIKTTSNGNINHKIVNLT